MAKKLVAVCRANVPEYQKEQSTADGIGHQREATGEGMVRVGGEGPKIAKLALRRLCIAVQITFRTSVWPAWARTRSSVRPLEPFAHFTCT